MVGELIAFLLIAAVVELALERLEPEIYRLSAGDPNREEARRELAIRRRAKPQIFRNGDRTAEVVYDEAASGEETPETMPDLTPTTRAAKRRPGN